MKNETIIKSKEMVSKALNYYGLNASNFLKTASGIPLDQHEPRNMIRNNSNYAMTDANIDLPTVEVPIPKDRESNRIPESPKKSTGVIDSIANDLTSVRLQQAIILSEIVGKPRSKTRKSRRSQQ